MSKSHNEESSSTNNAKSSSSETQEPDKEIEQVDSSQVLQVKSCSQCHDSSHGLYTAVQVL